MIGVAADIVEAVGGVKGQMENQTWDVYCPGRSTDNTEGDILAVSHRTYGVIDANRVSAGIAQCDMINYELSRRGTRNVTTVAERADPLFRPLKNKGLTSVSFDFKPGIESFVNGSGDGLFADVRFSCGPVWESVVI